MVGIRCTESDGVYLQTVKGTTEQMRKYLAKCVREDKKNDPDQFDYGDTKASDVTRDKYAEIETLNAYATYSDYHIDYTARVIDVNEIDVTL